MRAGGQGPASSSIIRGGLSSCIVRDCEAKRSGLRSNIGVYYITRDLANAAGAIKLNRNN